MRTISHNQVRTWRTCKRAYAFQYVALRVPRKKAPTLAFGSMWDEGLQAWWGEGSDSDRLMRALATLPRDLDDQTRQRVTAMFIGYTARWASAPLRLVATQVKFTVPIVHPETGAVHPECNLTGVLDAICETTDRRLVAIESKSSSEDITLGSLYWQRVAVLDSQVSTYLAGAKAAGYDIAECVYDVARKPELKLTKKETPAQYLDRLCAAMHADPDSYFQRQTLVRLEREEREHALDVWHYADEMTLAARTGRYPRNTSQCRQFGRTCEYLPVCSGEAAIDDPHLFADKRERNDARTNSARPAA